MGLTYMLNGYICLFRIKSRSENVKNTETATISARDQIAAGKFNGAAQADYRAEAAQANFNARMQALQARFDRDAASIRAAFVAEISEGGRR
jgi:hypothetical protein